MPGTFTDLRDDISLLRKFLTQRAYAARLIAFLKEEGIIDCSRKAARFTAEEFMQLLGAELGYKPGGCRTRMIQILLDFLEECGTLTSQQPDGSPLIYTYVGGTKNLRPLSVPEAAQMERIFASTIEFFDRCFEHAGRLLKGSGFLYEFDEGAATVWDRFLGNFEFKVAREFLLNSMNVYRVDGPRVLDLCCGTGHGLDAILRQWPDAKVTALDFTDTMRPTAMAKAGGHNGAIEWVSPQLWRGFGYSLPFEATSFDKVFFSCGDPYIEEALRAGVYREIKRVLKPGGILGSVAWAYPDRQGLHVNNAWIRLGVYIHDFAESVCRGWHGFHDAASTIQMAEELGFERCSVFLNNYYMLDTAVWIFKTPDGKQDG